jgi:HK97 family phage major capsid protein
MGLTDAAASRAREVSAEIATRSGRNPQGLFFPTNARPNAAERRDLSLTTGNGAALVQTDVSPDVIDILRNKSVVRSLGATVISGLIGNLAVPRISASSTTYWVADGASITASNPTIDQVTFSPHHVGGIVSLSRSIIMQSTPDAALLVENDLAALIATATDQAALFGSGTGGQPLGILSQIGLNVVPGGANGAAITWQNIQALVGSVDLSNALMGNLGFATNAKVTRSMRSALKTTTDTSSNFILGNNGQLAGYPLGASQNVSSTGTKGTGTGLSSMIFGDWSSLVIAEWSALDLLVNPYGASYSAGGVDVRAMATVDINFRHIPAFAALTDIIA